MKQLDLDFRESLEAEVDSDGNVVIAGIVFSPVEVLELDDDSYRDAFQRWLGDDYLPTKLDLLAETLRIGANSGRFADLCQAVCAQQVIPFVGSGMSAPTGMPLWTEFLRAMQKLSKLPEPALDALLAAGAYEEAATELQAHMPAALLNERLEQTFRARMAAEVRGTVRLLPEAFPGVVITTNFDNLLELVFEIANVPFQEVLFGTRIEDFRATRGLGKRCLLKLHGHHMTPSTRVLTRKEYDRFYTAGCAACEEVAICFRNSPMLYLGCSLTGDRTLELLKQVVAGDARTPRSYAFLRLPADKDETKHREHFLAERNIFPIWYERDHNEAIEALVVGLLRALKKL